MFMHALPCSLSGLILYYTNPTKLYHDFYKRDKDNITTTVKNIISDYTYAW